MKKWASKVKRTIKEDGGGRGRGKSTNLAIVSANNHYAGFGQKLPIYSERWCICWKLYGKKRRRKRTTNRTYRVT